MKENNTKAIPNKFTFVYKDDSENIVYSAVRRNDNKYYVTWILDNEHDSQLYKVRLVEMLVECGRWVIQDDL